MSMQGEAVRENVDYVGAATCDTCCGLILRGFSKERGGNAEG